MSESEDFADYDFEQEEDLDQDDNFLVFENEKHEATFSQIQHSKSYTHELLINCNSNSKSDKEILACNINKIGILLRIPEELYSNSKLYDLIYTLPFPQNKNPIAMIFGFACISSSTKKIDKQEFDKIIKSFPKIIVKTTDKENTENKITKLDVLRYAKMIETLLKCKK